MGTIKRARESGQSLVLVALMILGMLAILGLALDGGNLLMRRRTAQNAADAGALAGARTLCATKDAGQAVFMANQYATVHNDATSASVGIIDRTVAVTTTIPLNTYFIHLLGWNTVTAQAEAAAGCFNPTSGESVLPVAWICRAPVGGSVPSSSEDCQEQALTEAELNCRLNNPMPYCLDPQPSPPYPPIYPELYIIMDNIPTSDELVPICSSSGGFLDCDLDGDGDDDLISNGDRSWLNLDGGPNSANELRDWITTGFLDNTIYAHTWVQSTPGDKTPAYKAAANRVGDIVALPVYDAICDGAPDNNPNPPCLWHPAVPDTIIPGTGGRYYFHIVGFAAFYITCVQETPGKSTPPGGCPGLDYARSVNLDSKGKSLIPNNAQVIEGYFVQGFLDQLGGGATGGGVDLGVYTLYLTR